MLNRFKNAIYGSSAATEDITSVRIEYEYNETILPRRIRSTLFRSPSFRDDILRDSGKDSNNHHQHQDDIDVGKNRNIIRRATSDRLDVKDHNAYSQQAYNDQVRLTNSRATKVPKFRYSRPEFLQLRTDDEILVSADHQIRPIMLPRDVYSLPWRSGYAECINAGKSLRNEDQAVFYQDIIVKTASTIEEMDESSGNPDLSSMQSQIPWLYFGVFDGHAGHAVAVAAAAQLHNIIGEKLRQVADTLIFLEFEMNHDDDDTTDEYADCVASESEISHQEAVVNGNQSDGTNQAVESFEASPEVSANKDPAKNDLDSSVSIGAEDKKPAEKLPEDPQMPRPEVTSATTTTTTETDDSAKSIADSRSKSASQQNEYDKAHINIERARTWMEMCQKNVTVDSLIIGALESAFWEMDALIAEDKHDYKMAGGCTAIVSLFILGKLYVCNAGDSRAIVYKDNKVKPMSFDFTPLSERERILRLGQQRPEFLGNDFTHLEFIRRPTRRDLGKQMLYKDAYMTGWAMKTITYDDLKFPLVWGEGKRSRVLATIGVTRGFGDHELKAQYGSVHIKPFLTPEPEVRVLPLETDDSLTAADVLIMGSDGLWDVTTNQEAADIVRGSFELFSDNEETRSKYRYITAAQDLVIHSRGHASWNRAWRTGEDRFASLDDITVFVIPLKQYRDEYVEWKRLRSQASARSRDQQQQQLSHSESSSSSLEASPLGADAGADEQPAQKIVEPMSAATTATKPAEPNE